MYNQNTKQLWRLIHQKNQRKLESMEYKPPSKCTFCGKDIKDGDHFHAGYDRYKIYSETCDDIRCYQWLEHKVRKKRINYHTYM